MDMGQVVAGRHVCVCVGSGGVGKTTTSAALGLGLARRGHRVAVITIDPARRLASALGLAELPNEPHRVELEAEGELWAMMLDVKRTFDDVIERLAPDAATRDRIFANRIYGELSTAVAGSQEFTAIAKLYDLALDDRFDVLVLDTPPSRNALDFLEAPDRLSDFLEGRALRMLLRPAGVGAKIVGRSTGAVFGLLSKATGTDLLSDLSEFFRSLAGLTDGFRERAAHVKALLADPGTVFVLVTSPEREPIDEALFLAERLAAARLDLGGVVVNRMHHDMLGDADTEGVADGLREALGEALADRAATTLREYHVLARRDDAGVRRLLDGLGPVPLLLIPHLDADIADLAGLGDVERWLFATDDERAAMLDAVTA